MRLSPRCLPALVLMVATAFQAHGKTVDEVVVRIPRPESLPDQRLDYPMRLLDAALRRSATTYRIELYPTRMQQGRALLLLQKKAGIDIVSTMTSVEREARLQAIRIPIDKGLIGWRLLLMNKARTDLVIRSKSLDDLRALKAGQGADWPDITILRGNDLPVYGTSNYESLFKMLENQRLDYVPRAISEVWDELDKHQGLAVEPTLALHYPTAIYFFVRKGEHRLAADIKDGLEKMIADGSFEAMFQQHYAAMIRRAGLKGRRVIELHNPVMPAHMPVERKQLWFRE